MPVSKPHKRTRNFALTPIAAGIVVALASPMLFAQDNSELDEVIVTAQKRSENLQDVPISIQAIGEQSLRELNLQSFRDYTQMLPSVTFTPADFGPGSSFSAVYMRGIASGADGQATTSQPSVGMYLDELPITTILGNLDVHMYDVSRVEALAGPQGTLYGASSQAGTIRVITNKPDLTEYSGGFALEGSTVDGDDSGYVAEGFVNVPISDNAAIRLVGWARSDAGWIDNVLGSRTYPGHEDAATCGLNCSADDITLTNTDKAEDNYNTVDTVGARAALRVDLNDNWTLTPTAMYQKSESEGTWADDLSDFVAGDYAVTHFNDEFRNDEWTMLGLTIEGRIGNFDLVYAGSYLDRQVDGSYDYSDYSYWYDTIYTTGYYADLHFANSGPRAFPNQFDANAGSRIMGGAYAVNDDAYTKQNHELRISTDPSKRVRGMLGFFWQHQHHDFYQQFTMDGQADVLLLNQDEPSGNQFPGVVYLNSMDRDDRDRAVFGNVSFDIADDLELTLGARFFEPEVSVAGFNGFGLFWNNEWSSTGEVRCPSQQQVGNDTPCQNVDKGIKESESIGRVNLTWNISEDSMVYGTWSQGYRPGGINRKPQQGEYLSDFLTNWEAGWKTQWADNTFQFNGAVFFSEWDDIQIEFEGENAIAQVDNGPTAEVSGLEAQILWVPTDNLTLSAAVAFYNTELTADYVNFDDMGNIAEILAPKGTSLPITPDFKGNLIARYHFTMGSFDAHIQGAFAHQGSRGSELNVADNAVRGDVPAHTTLDLSFGIRNESYAVDLFVKNATGEDAPLYIKSACAIGTCGQQNYGMRVRPTTVAIKFSKDF